MQVLPLGYYKIQYLQDGFLPPHLLSESSIYSIISDGSDPIYSLLFSSKGYISTCLPKKQISVSSADHRPPLSLGGK